MIHEKVDQFWKDVAQAWFAMINSPYKEENFIWLNSRIRIEKKPVVWKSPFEKGLQYIHQLYEENGENIRTKEDLKARYGLTTMQYNSLISAIPQDLKQKWKNNMLDKTVALNSIRSGLQYENACYDQNLLVNKHKQWEQELEIKIDFQIFLQGFKDLYVVTNVAKYRSFQYRMLNWAIITNVHLKHWNIKDTNLCTFCGQEKETYLHLFIFCKYVQELWCSIEKFMDQEMGPEQIYFDTDTVFWTRIVPGNASHMKNFVCLIVKQYIYKKRCTDGKLSYRELRQNIAYIHSMEKFIATKNNKLARHNKKWFTPAD